MLKPHSVKRQYQGYSQIYARSAAAPNMTNNIIPKPAISLQNSFFISIRLLYISNYFFGWHDSSTIRFKDSISKSWGNYKDFMRKVLNPWQNPSGPMCKYVPGNLQKWKKQPKWIRNVKKVWNQHSTLDFANNACYITYRTDREGNVRGDEISFTVSFLCGSSTI